LAKRQAALLAGSLAMAKVAPFSSEEPNHASGGRDSHGAHHGHRRPSQAIVEIPNNRALLHNVQGAFREFLNNAGWYDSTTAQGIRKFIRGRTFSVLAMICLFLALFLGEIFVLAQVPTNTELDVVLTLVFAIFSFEFICLSLTDASYIFGFFFWMDLLGTASMVMDISYMSGADATEVENITKGSTNENVIVVRAARTAKLAARAGRLSRAVRLLKMLDHCRTGNKEEDLRKVKMARVISNQLQTVLSTRVAFLTITVVVVLPFFSVFSYPETDDSMSTWAELLDRNAGAFHDAVMRGSASPQAAATELFKSEVLRFTQSYDGVPYGPFRMCYGSLGSDDLFTCDKQTVDLNAWVSDYPFDAPERKASVKEINQNHIQIAFNMVVPYQQESAAGIALICFIVVIMCVFGLLMSNSISQVALLPLERMLSVVRERCQQIFKYTTDLKEEEESEEEDEEFDVDIEHSSEFMLLEKVVAKLAAIAHLSSVTGEPEVKEDMTENEIMTLNWMQGATANAAAIRMRPSGVAVVEESSSNTAAMGHPRELSGMLSKISPSIIEELSGWNFNALDHPTEMKIAIATYIVTYHDGSCQWVRDNIPEVNLFKFMTGVEAKYPSSNPFHNYSHGLDVLYSVSQSMRLTSTDRILSDTAQFWLLIAAIGHDLGHLGVNNQFLVETTHDIAVKYNDRSPLENMHCATLFQLASSSPETNIFIKVEKEVYREMRKGMIAAILHTDMMKHNEMIKELGLLYQMNSEQFDNLNAGAVMSDSNSHTQTVENAFLHCADIGNPMKPWELCYQLAHLCLDEFFAQGDKEKELGIPVQMLNDREKVNRPNSQVGFIEFVIAPMAESITNLFPQLDALPQHLSVNVQKWMKLWIEEAHPPEEPASKVQERVKRIVLRCKAVTREERGIPVPE